MNEKSRGIVYGITSAMIVMMIILATIEIVIQVGAGIIGLLVAGVIVWLIVLQFAFPKDFPGILREDDELKATLIAWEIFYIGIGLIVMAGGWLSALLIIWAIVGMILGAAGLTSLHIAFRANLVVIAWGVIFALVGASMGIAVGLLAWKLFGPSITSPDSVMILWINIGGLSGAILGAVSLIYIFIK